MVRILGYSSQARLDDVHHSPREIAKTPSTAGGSGWLVRFFDSAFFCEWIAVSYLYKHEHDGVRDYLCNRMYTLPHAGIETYLAQLCSMLVHKTSPALDKFIVDMSSKSIRIALKVHWFLLAEQEAAGDSNELSRLQERCQMAALMGDWQPLMKPKRVDSSPSPSSKSRMFKQLLASRGLLNLTSSPSPSPSPQKQHFSLLSPSLVQVDQEPKTLTEDSDSSLKVFKKLMPGTKACDAFFKKFSLKEDGGDLEQAKENSTLQRENEYDSFFRRLLGDKDDNDRAVRSEELGNSESFFRRLFREKVDTEDKSISKASEEDGFFRKLLFRDKTEDKYKVEDKGSRNLEVEKGSVNCEDEETSDFFFFRRIFRVHPDGEDSKPVANIPEAPVPDSENSPANESFLMKVFRDRSVEESRSPNMRKEESFNPVSFLMKLKLFKDKNDEAVNAVSESGVAKERNNEEAAQDVASSVAANGFQKVAKLYRDDCDGTQGETGTDKCRANYAVSEMDVTCNGFTDRSYTEPLCSLSSPVRETPATTPTSLLAKRPGSPKQKTEKTILKSPLSKYSSFQLRKGTYHATLDFIQSLCEISTGLVDVFPVEDRKKSLHESLVEVNGLLKSAENDGGVCFPMGTGLYRIVNIPLNEATLLNSREKAPYSICLEIDKCNEEREAKEPGLHKLARGTIPVACGGDTQLQQPPPWAYPVWNQHSNTNNMLRAASKAIDRAMNNIWEVKYKFVHVSLSVSQGCIDEAPEQATKRELHFSDDPAVEADHNLMQTDRGDCGREPTSLHLRDSNGCVCTDMFQFGEGGDLRRSTQSFRQRDAHSVQADTLLRLADDQDGSHLPSDEWVSVILTAVPGLNMEDINNDAVSKKKDHRRVPSTVAMAQVKAAAAKGEGPIGPPVKNGRTGAVQVQLEDISGNDARGTDAVAGELWERKKNRIQKSSKFGNLPGWDLHPVIVKSGDDCRQEHMAVQLVSHFYDIFQEAGLPLWLRPYEILVTSSSTALIEMIPDTASIHSIKSRNPNISSLREFFCNKYEDNSPAFKLAQRNFVESMAAYSILSYILQVKDRHNGNLLLDEEGHIIHIDFGFMLSNSPGGVNFESAPFKLTRELLEVMDSDAEGSSSEFFDYFKVLCIQGFLTCRKHAERIILLVEMMQDSGYPCFKAGPKTIQNLWKRFHLTLTEEQCVSLVLSLISSSLDAWRTRQYDYYQRVLNGIL